MNEIRKSARSPVNRIQSILEDSSFVSSVKQTYDRKLVANMRCGLWYIPTDMVDEKCYFKSTDGHTHQWQFSLKRLNFHLLDLIEQNNGCIIVDSTRSGKLMPDALSKTVPIWCGVLNFTLLGLPIEECLFFPKCVSLSEQDQIRNLVKSFSDNLKRSISPLPRLTKRLHPIFVTPNEMLPYDEFSASDEIIKNEHPVILCTASKRALDGQLQMSGYLYVQGAGDDHELWAPSKFTPELFWTHKELHNVQLSETELVGLMEQAVINDFIPIEKEDLKQAAPRIFIGSFCEPKENQILIDLRTSQRGNSDPNPDRVLSLPIPGGKRGARELAQKLNLISKFYEDNCDSDIVILCDLGEDFAHCVALMINCRYIHKRSSKEDMVRINAVQMQQTGIIPSRITQNVVGNFLRS